VTKRKTVLGFLLACFMIAFCLLPSFKSEAATVHRWDFILTNGSKVSVQADTFTNAIIKYNQSHKNSFVKNAFLYDSASKNTMIIKNGNCITASNSVIEFNSRKYLTGLAGVLQKGNGLKTINGNTYLFYTQYSAQGISYFVTGKNTYNNKTYYFNPLGVMVKNQTVNGIYYGFDGSIQKGWLNKNNKYYYYINGVLQTNKVLKIDGYLYGFWPDGVMYENHVATFGKDTYYFKGNGRAITNDIMKISGKYYYFGSNGKMVKNKWESISLSFGTRWYYLGADGAAYANRWFKCNGKWYYFDQNAIMVTGTKKIDGVTYKFNSNGVCTNKSK
jgi:glucan-binding YG repeat protein